MQVIIPGETQRFGLRLVAYAPNGPRRGPLQPLEYEAAWPLDDVPALKVSYTAHVPGAGLLAVPCEVAVEVWDGTAWAEPPDSRFLRIVRDGNESDPTSARSYELPGYAWMARKLVLYPPASVDALVDGKRPFLSATPGQILQTWLAEGRARGAVPGFGWDFTTTHDSNGAPWAKIITIYYEPGMDLLTCLINLSEQGMVDWQMQGRTLRVFNADTVLARDLASGTAPVDLKFGRDVVEAPTKGTLEDAASAVLVVGDEGMRLELTNPGATAPWGRWEQYIGQGGVSDPGTATLLAQSALERAGRERVQVTRGITPQAARWLPWRDYRPGDQILAPSDHGAMESLRVRQVTLTMGRDGIAGNLVLNDRFLEREIRQSRRTAGIVGGSTADGGSGARPAPESPTARVPAAPQGLIVDAQAYVDMAGFPQGLAVATWGAVITDVGGVAVDTDGYELFVRVNEFGAPWFMVVATDRSDTSATVSPLVVGGEYAFKVRATCRGVKGEFSAVVAVTIPDDVTPPPVPTAPTLSTRLGQIYVTWDGLGEGDVPMPSDFRAVRVWMQDPLAPGGQVVGYLDAAGSVVVPHQPYGADREFWFTSVDRSGNESGESVHAFVATASLVDTDVIGEIIDGAENIIDGTIPGDAKITANSITGRLIRALEIQAGHIQSNAITADKIDVGAVRASHIAVDAVEARHIKAGAVTASKISADAVQAGNIAAGAIDGMVITGATVRTSSSGARVELNSGGIGAWSAGNVQTVSIAGANGTFFLRSGSSGARVELDTTGLRAYNAGGTQTVAITAGDGSVAIIGQASSGTGGNRMVLNPAGSSYPEIRFYGSNGSTYAAIRGPATVSAEPEITLGGAVGANGRTPTLLLGSGFSDWSITGGSIPEARIRLWGGGDVDINGTTLNLRTTNSAARLNLTTNGWVDFFGKMGAPGASGAVGRGNVTFSGSNVVGGSVGYGYTFTGGDAFVVGNVFYMWDVLPSSLRGRNNGGFSFEMTKAAGSLFDFSFWVWKQ
ncbi:hypothetical protein ACQP1V_42780 (plasmid) [Microtetraspora malaysiensis]|uniref:hypothetical protein n=1 Tax=Microtetraspora malaysiensis TaxID=161358 RepID=UPI003D8CD89F